MDAMKFLFGAMVVLFLVHTNSAYPRRKQTKHRPAPLLPPRPRPRPMLSSSSSDTAKRLYLCRSQGQFPCFGQTLRCYPRGEICNSHPYCRYHDDELNCPDSRDRRKLRTFTIRITKTTGPAKFTFSTTTSTTTIASGTVTSTSTTTSVLPTSLTPSIVNPFSTAQATVITTFQRLVTTLSPVIGFVPGPGLVCVDLAAAAAAVSPAAASVRTLSFTNIMYSNSLEVVAVCTSASVQV